MKILWVGKNKQTSAKYIKTKITKFTNFICESCGKTVERYTNKHCSDRFCSSTCYYTWRSNHPELNYFHTNPRVGPLNGNFGRCENHKKVDMAKIALMGRQAQISNLTNPERKLYEILINLEVPFEPQKWIDSYRVDAFVEPNIVIEVDGEYWHNYPEGKSEDRKRDSYLIDHGYEVKRFWAKDILTNGETLIKGVLS